MSSLEPTAAASAPDGGPYFRTRVVLLGTAGGPRLLSGRRFGVSTAIVHDEDVYLVDLGAGSPMRLIEAGLAGGPRHTPAVLDRVRGIFFTHLHSDHTVEWPMLYAVGSLNVADPEKAPIEVFGPGDRGSLVRVHPPQRPEPAVIAPGAPVAGIRGMTERVEEAFAADLNDRARDSDMRPPVEVFHLHEIDLSEHWEVDPGGVPPRLAAPLQVWQDRDVRVTATLVDHRPTAPSFAFRFDTPDGSVVVSGDTRVSENLIDLARGADVLVHEVIDARFADVLASQLGERGPAVREHLLASHTTIEQVGRDVAEVAGVRQLVLTHLVPAHNPVERWTLAQEGFTGRLVVGEDLMDIGVGDRRG